MPPKVQKKNTYKDSIKLHLERLKKKAVDEHRKNENNTANSNTCKDGVKSELERLKQMRYTK